MNQDTNEFDTIVIGVGGMGSATVHQLAKRGVDVLGLERYSIPHSMGSSHGYTRIIRMAYHEDPAYVSLVNRAYDLWKELQAEHGNQLLYNTGSISAGLPSSEVVTGAIEACNKHSLTHEQISGEKLTERFPGYSLPDSYTAIYQPDGGFLRSEECIVAHVDAAHRHGAEIHAREKVTGWDSISDGVRVKTDKDQYKANRLVIAAGAWTGQLVESIDESVTPERQVLAWIQPEKPELFSPNDFPVFVMNSDSENYYGFPIHQVPGVKVGLHHHLEEIVDPDKMEREPTANDEEILQNFVEEHLSIDDGKVMGLETCIYTNSPDHDFIIDTLDDHPEVTVLGGFSGHGYKFASVIGEIAAKKGIGEEVSFDTSLFSIERL